MRRHALVINPNTNWHGYVPYGAEECDTPKRSGSITEQVTAWCLGRNIPGPIVLTETASKSNLRVRLY